MTERARLFVAVVAYALGYLPSFLIAVILLNSHFGLLSEAPEWAQFVVGIPIVFGLPLFICLWTYKRMGGGKSSPPLTCAKCGYDLRAHVVTTCPECGEPTTPDPAVPRPSGVSSNRP